MHATMRRRFSRRRKVAFCGETCEEMSAKRRKMEAKTATRGERRGKEGQMAKRMDEWSGK